jgi:hypothetical protein
MENGALNTPSTTSLFQLTDGSSRATDASSIRREIKFALPLADLGKLRTILEVNLRRKVFNQRISHVSSLYFDDHALSACHENINGVEKRGKLRLRWYDDQDSKFFFEVKRRMGNALEKRRLAIESTEGLGSLSYNDVARELSRVLPPRDTELLHARREPVLMTSYKREHFSSREESTRVTLDYDIRCFQQYGARRLRTRFGVPIPDLVVVEGKTPPDSESELPHLLAPLRPVLTKSSKYVMGCHVLGLLPGYPRDPFG